MQAELDRITAARTGLDNGLTVATTRLDHRTVPFLGSPAPTMTAPASFARAWRAPLVPVRCVRSGDGYLLSVEEPLELQADLSREDGELDLLRRQNEVFSRWIAETPEQWAWYLPRFRREG